MSSKAERLANWAWQHGSPSEALPALQEAVRLSGRAPAFLKALAVKQAKASQVADAIDTLEELVRKAPQDIEAWCIMGELSYDRGDYARAARALNLCMQLDPSKTHPSGLRARAIISRASKRKR